MERAFVVFKPKLVKISTLKNQVITHECLNLSYLNVELRAIELLTSAGTSHTIQVIPPSVVNL